jgi:3-oxoacyl-[acyl-carrier protein] reductase
MLLEGKVAWITGAGRGIGKAISLRFADEGASLILCARTAGQLEGVVDAVRAKGRPCVGAAIDVSKAAEVERLAQDGVKTFGRIDILVNNAGISNPKPFLETTDADWDDALRVNLLGVVACTRAALPGMLQRGAGAVVNIASAAGLRGLPGSPAYSASKAAVVALSQALADEVSETGVRVNVVCPGPIRTELFDTSPVRDFLLQSKARVMTPEDVAGCVVYLASDLSGGLNSQTICVRTTTRW